MTTFAGIRQWGLITAMLRMIWPSSSVYLEKLIPGKAVPWMASHEQQAEMDQHPSPSGKYHCMLNLDRNGATQSEPQVCHFERSPDSRQCRKRKERLLLTKIHRGLRVFTSNCWRTQSQYPVIAVDVAGPLFLSPSSAATCGYIVTGFRRGSGCWQQN